MGILSLGKAIREVNSMKPEVDITLDTLIAKNFPFVKEEYNRWRNTYRLNSTAFISFLAKQLCALEGIKFDERKKERIYLAAAAAFIVDDLMDKKSYIRSEDISFLQNDYESINLKDEERLFFAFHSILEKRLPKDFKLKFQELIKRYNQAQEKGSKLNGNLSKEELVEIKNETGGYPILLLYKLMFQNGEDHIKDSHPFYLPKEMEIPKTKDNAIFNYGAFLSRLDDLYDLDVDTNEGRKSLATEGLVTWNSLSRDIKYVREGFNRFYPKERVSHFMKPYSVRSIILFNSLERLLAFN